MPRAIRKACLLAMLLFAALFAANNRTPVSLNLAPFFSAEAIMPLYLYTILAALAGLAIGLALPRKKFKE
jgi:uncharacterized integral membrane protein